MAKYVEKTRVQLISALEDHLYLLSRTLKDLGEGDGGQMRQLSTQLRGLIGASSGVTGLLWRLCDELGVDDTVEIRALGGIESNAPITKGLRYAFLATSSDGSTPLDIPPVPTSLRRHIQEAEAFFVDGESISHEYLIGRLANETGTAHELDRVSKSMAKLNSLLIGDIQAYFHVINYDAVLTLEVGERIIQKAVGQGYVRRRPISSYAPNSKIEFTEFEFKPDVPVLPLNGAQGSIVLGLEVPKLPNSKRLEAEILFPVFTQGTVQVDARITRRRKLQVLTTGLPLPYFGFDASLPEKPSGKLMIGISWSNDFVKAYVNGVQVAGPRDTL
jgi:hypothetical protein